MTTEDLYRYLCRNKSILIEKMDKFKISFDDVENFCILMNMTVEEDEGRIYFKNETGELIEDFTKYEYPKDNYKTIIMIFRNKEDCADFGSLFPCLKGHEISNITKEIVMDDMEHGIIYNTKRGETDGRLNKDNMVRVHSDYMWDAFDHWRDMPEFYFNVKKSWYTKITVKFNKDYFTDEVLSKIFHQNVHPKTDSLWHPKWEKGEFTYFRVIGGSEAPKFPIFVISKGRSDQWKYHTSQSLTRMDVHHYLCVEPQEIEKYKASRIAQSPYCHIIEMDMTYKDTFDPLGDIGTTKNHGPGPARNFCGDFARKLGAKWCWILDDNTEEFHRFWRARRFLAFTPEIFRSCERFVERYENIAIAGLNYHMFMISQDSRPPFVANTRVFSYHLWNLEAMTKLGVKQRGRYNDDVILSLDLLEKGWCSVLFNHYVPRKMRTQLIKGGCTTDIYKEEYGGTFAKSQQLCEVFPQYTSLVWKFKRWHHEVNYHVFRQKLKIKPEYAHLLEKDYNQVNEHGAYVVRIDPKYHLKAEYDNKDFLERRYPRGCPEDITHDLMYIPDDRNNLELRNFWDFEEPGECKLVRKYRDEVQTNAEEKIVDSPLFDDVPVQQEKKTPMEIPEIPEDSEATVNIINTKVEAKRVFENEYSIDDL